MVAIRPATPDDVAFVVALERAPSSQGFISRFEPERHAALMATSDDQHLIGLDGAGERIGFAILWGLDDLRHGNVLLKRVAVEAPGRGLGRPFLAAVIDHAFARPETYRLWLTVGPRNERAQHVYRSLGFVPEGRLRQTHARPDGTREDALQMSLLRPEWEARQRTP